MTRPFRRGRRSPRSMLVSVVHGKARRRNRRRRGNCGKIHAEPQDAVEIRRVSENVLEGTSPEVLRHLVEIRGLGVLNVMTLFGAGAIRKRKDLDLVIKLEMWDDGVAYDRLGLDETSISILEVDVPLIVLPVRPGRNLAVILEVAAMNQRLKLMGHNAARELTERMTQAMQSQ